MHAGIRAFGTTDPIRLTFTIDSGTDAGTFPLSFPRSLWFDRDSINGRWLVWASGPVDPKDDPMELGAIVVQDPTVTAFLEELGLLLCFPQRFAREPHFEFSDRQRE